MRTFSLGRLRFFIKIRRNLNASIMIARDWKWVLDSVFILGRVLSTSMKEFTFL